MPKNTISGELRLLTKEDMFLLADKAIHETLNEKLYAPGVIGLVCYENLEIGGSHSGERTFMIYGPGCTYKTIEECAKGRLGSVPSIFQYPVAYYEKSETARQEVAHA